MSNTKIVKYIIRDTEAGNYIDEFDTLVEAEKTLLDFENHDQNEGIYTPNFYEIISVDANGNKVKAVD